MVTSVIPDSFAPRSTGTSALLGPELAAPIPMWSAADAADQEIDLRWDPLLACAAVYILAAVGRIHQVVPVLGLLRPAILAGLIAIGLWFIDRHEERRARLLWMPTTKYVVALAVWMMLAVPGALVVGNSFELVFNNFLKTALMLFVVAGAVRGPRDVERLALAYLVGAAVYAGAVLTTFDLGADWRLDDLYYYDANDFATFAVTALPFGIYFLHAGRDWRTRLLGAVALAVLSLAFVMTGSRGGFVALVAVGVFIVLRYSAIALRRRVIATGLVALAVLGTASETYWKQMTTILSDADYNRTDESGRMQIWSRGVGYMLDYPILGVGPANFQTAEGTLSSFADRQQMGRGVRWNAAHNSFIQIGAELGIPGLLLFVAITVGAIRALLKSSRRASERRALPPSLPALTQALAASLIGFVVGACFLSLAYSEMVFSLVALAVGLLKCESRT